MDENLAKYFQEGIVNFIRYMDPNPEDSTLWEEYSANNRKVMNMGNPTQLVKPDYSHSLGKDLMNRTKCEYWQSAPYYAPGTKGGNQQFAVQDEGHVDEL